MANSYYTPSGVPSTGSPGASAPIRSELANIGIAFDKLPPLTAGKAVVVNGGGTGLTVTTGSLALAGDFSTTGAFSTVFAQQASVTLTLPAVNGTLATLAGTETLSNKTFVAPALGTPASGVLTNCTGLPLANGVTGTLAVANGGTGTTTSTGTGAVVKTASPAISDPNITGYLNFLDLGRSPIMRIGDSLQWRTEIGYPSSTSIFYIQNYTISGYTHIALNPLGGNVGIGNSSPAYLLDVSGTGRFTGAVTLGSTINKITLTAPASGATLTIADGKTLTVSDNATISGTHNGTSSGTNTGDQTLPTWSSLGGGTMGQRDLSVGAGSGPPTGGVDGQVVFYY